MHFIVWEKHSHALCPQVVQCKAHCLRQSMPITQLLISVFHYITSIFSTARVLGPNDLETVLTELQEVRAVWYNIGIALKLTPGVLDAIKGPYKEHKDCLRDMLLEWMNNSPNSSWEGLILALKSPIVGHARLADHLQTICRTQELPAGIGM